MGTRHISSSAGPLSARVDAVSPGWTGAEFPIQCSWPLGTRHVGTGLAGGRAYSCAARSPSSARGCGRRVVEADWGAVQPPYHEHTDEYPDDAAAGSAA